MSEFYQDMQAVASELLAAFDQGGIYYVGNIPGTGSADNPGVSTDATPVKLDGVARGVAFKYIDASTVIASDLQITAAVRSDMTPQMPGFIMIDGARYKIIAIKPIPPAGTPVAHAIIFRK